jgi:hypothetical protein
VCFLVLHSSQDHLRIGTCDFDHPISCWCQKNTDSWHARKGYLQRAFPLDDLMVPTPKLSFIANNNNPTDVGLAPDSTIHFDSLGFIADHLGRLSLFPQERELGAIFIGMIHSGSSSMRTTLGESSNDDGATSGTGGSLGSPGPRECNVVTSIDTLLDTPVPENALALQTILTVTVRTAAPQPEIELCPDQQQAY